MVGPMDKRGVAVVVGVLGLAAVTSAGCKTKQPEAAAKAAPTGGSATAPTGSAATPGATAGSAAGTGSAAGSAAGSGSTVAAAAGSGSGSSTGSGSAAAAGSGAAAAATGSGTVAAAATPPTTCTVGEPVVFASSTPAPAWVRVATRGDASAAMWTEGMDAKVANVAILDGAGKVVAGPTEFARTSAQVDLARTDAGFVMREVTNDREGCYGARVRTIALDGTLGEPVEMFASCAGWPIWGTRGDVVIALRNQAGKTTRGVELAVWRLPARRR